MASIASKVQRYTARCSAPSARATACCSFHSSVPLRRIGMQPVLRKANPVAEQEWNRILPSISIFNAAIKRRILPFDRNTAAAILADCWLMGIHKGNVLGKDEGQKICEKYGIEPFDLTMLAQVLLRSPRELHAPLAPSPGSLGKHILSIAATMGDTAAIIRLASIALKGASALQYKSTEYKVQMDHLEALARKHVVEAILLLAQTLTSNGEVDKSIVYWQEAGEAGSGYAWGELGKLRERAGDFVSAEMAFLRGVELDDAESHYRLSQLPTMASKSLSSRHLLIAAASGVQEAATVFGVILSKKETSTSKLMASEWLSIGAKEESTLSKIT